MNLLNSLIRWAQSFPRTGGGLLRRGDSSTLGERKRII